MSSYAVFRIGEVEFGQIRNEVDAEILAVFTDEMLVRRTVRASEHYDWWELDYPTAQESHAEDRDVVTVALVGPGRVIAARLDLMGITETEVAALLEGQFRTHFEHWSDEELDRLEPEFESELRAQRAAAESLTIDAWRETVRDLGGSLWADRPFAQGSAGWMLNFIDGWEWRHVLRLLLTIWPDEPVELDLTDLFEGGWMEPEEQDVLPSAALRSLRETAAAHAPIVVLTEGRTDAEFLRAAFALLYPGLHDLIRFLDYSARPEGGAAALVRSVKAFAAAGIANRVVALFDNDAAACDAMRSLDTALLPSNILVLQYPDIESAKNYPTLGPPSAEAAAGRIDTANVNGLAGSIELYLGRDVLTQEDGTLAPVQWRSYIQGVRAYQGEIVGKELAHQRFRAKVERGYDPSEEDGWVNLKSILDVILRAFIDRDLPEHLCEHTGRSETRIRVRRPTVG